MIEQQILDTINVGIIVLDADFIVRQWNRWMAQYSGIEPEAIRGQSLFDHYPHLDNVKFRRNCKAVLRFGNFCFFSQKLHGHLFSFRPSSTLRGEMEFMQQNCTVGPLYSDDREIRHLFISVEDVTEAVLYQNRLVEMNRRDALTGLFNRRYLNQRLVEEFERARRYRRPLSLIMTDIDHFKRINDTYGHQFGDQVIRAVAATLTAGLRKVDGAARYGGEEFCCYLPETDGDGAVGVAERLRQRVAQLGLVHESVAVPVTMSFGVAVAQAAMGDHESLLKAADDALYQAKHNGRNQVCRFSPNPQTVDG